MSSPAARIRAAFQVSEKKPRESAKRRGTRRFTSGIAVSAMSSTIRPREINGVRAP
jgi:hypothetical protein